MHLKPIGIGASTIDVWQWSLDVPLDALPQLVSALDEAEFARAGRFVHERHRLRFIAGRGRLRAILGAYLGVPARRLSFSYNAFGKPRLAGRGEPPLHFNLSHSGGMAVLAVSDRYRLGIDIERVLPFRENLAAHFFSPAENEALAAVPSQDYLGAFFRCWTRKEAFVKAHGAGLSLPLESFDVTIDPEGQPRLLRLDGVADAPAQWRLANLALPRGYVGAVAAMTAGNAVALNYRGRRQPAPGRETRGAWHPGARLERSQALRRASRM
ncbi:4'-phosphopantetheinyl transferase superfamily protein [Nitratireductor aquimarinus]|uniref:4'-phosphopantetheinyl transferase family protein n=1 Tax=Alphaproteobacteria TaxID=28211 RepID=UPI0019D3BE6A|nr:MULTISPECIES: 4'-phosphopantetheinyl transferase superfamily protein [Alphaproteobacteria]MBN7755754.1 4'-phosphopantetheinyl transferase superfamily protein [Nitratireductor aquimarinus]MBY5998508.1 4'-phosphopantetheinyl transferase superfamily protein [Tritonibacter mobilis]MBY6020540.1 4'-phosphopantetheinyl transferase superfamily protein [Nitratireductor sp. DP7N14-4]